MRERGYGKTFVKFTILFFWTNELKGFKEKLFCYTII